MDTELRNDAMIELGVFVNKLKEILQKTPVDMDDEDRSAFIIARVVNETVLEHFTNDLGVGGIISKLKWFFNDADITHNKK